MKNLKEILLWGKDYLAKKGIDSSLLDTEIIISSVLNKDKSYLYAHPERIVEPDLENKILNMIKKRGERLPLSYILNEREFFGNSFYVEKGVFTPRPETELIVEEAIKTVKKDYADRLVNLFEIGLGTGAISVSLALALRNVFIIGCDISQKALSVTKKNILRYQLQNKINIFRGEDFSAIKTKKFDIIISNPPYLSFGDYISAQREVRVEPKRALMAKERGLFLTKRIIRKGKNYLKEKGYIFIEIGDGQGEYLKEYAENFGYVTDLIPDYAGIERVLKLKL
ncbi:MAG: peptide chain release factor N(5)-glutamine methyltransferase [Proteobacteria bacterium]|nr:peptide chain release factor N(5)-glutamine methyltransferase [Pseudomonadota bacterium]